ncbi:MAG TPA: cobaltochelatase subunit CobN, partial [Candidatus Dormibacteraeota bacterium]|nr:cobaltochelatase subunit CobN [Candidatus Dormibacteraeota bacterium]
MEAHNPIRVDQELLSELVDSVPDRWAICLRLLGGRRAWESGFDRLRSAAQAAHVPFLAIPGEQGQDLELEAASSVAPELLRSATTYLDQGGVGNLAGLLGQLSDCLRGTSIGAPPPTELPQHGIYLPGQSTALNLEQWLALPRGDGPVVAIAFYRAHWMSGNLDFVDGLCRGIVAAGGEALPFFCYSLRDPGPHELPAAVADCLVRDGAVVPQALVMTLSFSVAQVQVDGGTVADEWTSRWMTKLDIPVLQAITVTSTRSAWEGSSAGLAPLDVAMQVALPEFDGRIIGPPVSFKEQIDGTPRYVPDEERCRALGRLAVNHAGLGRRANSAKRIALVLSSYPTKNARVGNAVGLDTPASALHLLQRLKDEGYEVGSLPATGDDLIQSLIEAGVYDRDYLSGAQMQAAPARVHRDDYQIAWERLPGAIRTEVSERWGSPPGKLYLDGNRLHFGGLQFGNVLLTVQPPRGFGDNPIAIYHDPGLAPTHHYVAFYRWLEESYQADAIIHLGKHGTLEWLPGKSVGMSNECFPDALAAAVPWFYPFVVNDPGEG